MGRRRRASPGAGAENLWGTDEAPPGDAKKLYTVYVPRENKTLFRAVTGTSPDALQSSFRSNQESGWPRRVRHEDTADYLAISAFDTLEAAKAQALALNPIFNRKGRHPLTHVARFTIEGAEMHAYAPEGPGGHHLVWGDSLALALTVEVSEPI